MCCGVSFLSHFSISEASSFQVVLEFSGAAGRTRDYVAEVLLRLGSRRAMSNLSEVEGRWNLERELTTRDAEQMVDDLNKQLVSPFSF